MCLGLKQSRNSTVHKGLRWDTLLEYKTPPPALFQGQDPLFDTKLKSPWDCMNFPQVLGLSAEHLEFLRFMPLVCLMRILYCRSFNTRLFRRREQMYCNNMTLIPCNTSYILSPIGVGAKSSLQIDKCNALPGNGIVLSSICNKYLWY